AIEAFLEVEAHHLDTLSQHEQMELMYMLGEQYTAIGDYENAGSYYQKAFENISEVTSPAEQANLRLALVKTYQRLRKTDQSSQLLSESVQWAEQAKVPEERALILNNIGMAYDNLREYELARKYIEQAVSEPIEDNALKVTILTNMAVVAGR